MHFFSLATIFATVLAFSSAAPFPAPAEVQPSKFNERFIYRIGLKEAQPFRLGPGLVPNDKAPGLQKRSPMIDVAASQQGASPSDASMVRVAQS